MYLLQCKWETYQGSNANYIGGNKFKKSENNFLTRIGFFALGINNEV